jgi:hypothetical protein
MPLAPPLSDDPNSFWQIYKKSYEGSLADAEKETYLHLMKFSLINLSSTNTQSFSCCITSRLIHYALSWVPIIAATFSIIKLF